MFSGSMGRPRRIARPGILPQSAMHRWLGGCLLLLYCSLPAPAQGWRAQVVLPTVDQVDRLAFSPDCTRLAAVVGSQVVLLETAQWKEVARLKLPSLHRRLLAFSPDGKSLYTACLKPHEPLLPVRKGEAVKPPARSALVQFWDLESRKVQRVIEVTRTWAFWADLTPDGKTLVLIGEWGIRLYDTANGKQRLSFEAPKGAGAFTISPDSRFLAVGATEGEVFLYELASGKRLAARQAHITPPASRYKWVTVLAFQRDSKKLVCLSNDRQITTFSIPNGKKLAHVEVTQIATGGVRFGWLTRDGKGLLISNPDTRYGFTCIDLATGKIPAEHRRPQAPYHLSQMAVSPDGAHIAVSKGDIRIWSPSYRPEEP
jgi:WD40 repeat protein